MGFGERNSFILESFKHEISCIIEVNCSSVYFTRVTLVRLIIMNLELITNITELG